MFSQRSADYSPSFLPLQVEDGVRLAAVDFSSKMMPDEYECGRI